MKRYQPSHRKTLTLEDLILIEQLKDSGVKPGQIAYWVYNISNSNMLHRIKELDNTIRNIKIDLYPITIMCRNLIHKNTVLNSLKLFSPIHIKIYGRLRIKVFFVCAYKMKLCKEKYFYYIY